MLGLATDRVTIPETRPRADVTARTARRPETRARRDTAAREEMGAPERSAAPGMAGMARGTRKRERRRERETPSRAAACDVGGSAVRRAFAKRPRR